MKAYSGSIQRKGRRLYLVFRRDGKQSWVALKTDNMAVARQRAAVLASMALRNGEDWLHQLVKIGEKAKKELLRRKSSAEITWGNIAERFFSEAFPPVPHASRQSYQRWLELLEENMKRNFRRVAISPAEVTRETAGRIASELRATHISAGRMLTFYRRVWRVLSLDDAIWTSIPPGSGRPCRKPQEFYRRLTMEELRSVIDYLSDPQTRPKNVCRMSSELRTAILDMVSIGFCTGLRLSDVAELERSEVSPDGRFLHIVPNKVRSRKPRTLVVPLIGRALAAVQRRLMSNTGDSGAERFLFPSIARNRPSRRISAIFNICGIRRAGNGRASFHSLRATFISLMDEAGIPPHITDAITGHAGGGIHARYTQPSPDALADAVMKALPPL